MLHSYYNKLKIDTHSYSCFKAPLFGPTYKAKIVLIMLVGWGSHWRCPSGKVGPDSSSWTSPQMLYWFLFCVRGSIFGFGGSIFGFRLYFWFWAFLFLVSGFPIFGFIVGIASNVHQEKSGPTFPDGHCRGEPQPTKIINITLVL